MIAQTKTATANTQSPSFQEDYPFAVLSGDLEEQQLQIDVLRTEMNEIKSRYITLTNTTAIFKIPLSPSYLQEKTPVKITQPAESFIRLTDPKYLISEKHRMIYPDATQVLDIVPLAKETSVPLHALLKFVGMFMCTTALASIAFWLSGLAALFNPFISLLTLVASPFAYLMGVAAQRR